MTRKALYPGTFDPITNGHVDVITRASQLFDEVIVVVAESAGKNPLFGLQERVDLAKQTLASLTNVQVKPFNQLLVHVAETEQAHIVVRGVRSFVDYEYEAQMANMNKTMFEPLETVFLQTKPELASLSSTLVRDIARHQGDVTPFVSRVVAAAVVQKLG